MKDIIFALGVLFVILMVALSIQAGLVTLAWNLMIVPTWGVASISFWQALTASVLFFLITPVSFYVKTKKD